MPCCLATSFVPTPAASYGYCRIPRFEDEARVCSDLRDLAGLAFSSVLLGDGDSLFTGARAAFDRLLAALPPT